MKKQLSILLSALLFCLMLGQSVSAMPNSGSNHKMQKETEMMLKGKSQQEIKTLFKKEGIEYIPGVEYEKITITEYSPQENIFRSIAKSLGFSKSSSTYKDEPYRIVELTVKRGSESFGVKTFDITDIHKAMLTDALNIGTGFGTPLIWVPIAICTGQTQSTLESYKYQAERTGYDLTVDTHVLAWTNQVLKQVQFQAPYSKVWRSYAQTKKLYGRLQSTFTFTDERGLWDLSKDSINDVKYFSCIDDNYYTPDSADMLHIAYSEYLLDRSGFSIEIQDDSGAIDAFAKIIRSY